MLRRKRLTAVAVLALPLLVAAWVVPPPTGASGRLPEPRNLRPTGASPSLAPARPVAVEVTGSTPGFRIGGGLTGLYPGGIRTLHLTLTNTLSVTITVTSVKTTVVANKASCPASYLHVPAFSGHVTIAAHGTGSAKVAASLLHSAPNACQGATFQLHYAGLGTAS